MSITTEATPDGEASRRKRRAALFSIFASLAITIAKFVAGLLSGSLALMSDAGHALIDTGATILTYFAVRIADKPADDVHHYGHGKVESLAALIETGLLFGLGAYVLIEAVGALRHGGGHFEPTPLVFLVLLGSIAVDFTRWRSLSRIARETGSQALAADALHFSSDLASSGLVLAGLGLAVFGFQYGDALAAVGVAAFISIAGYKLGKRTLDTLLDAAPRDETPRIRALIAGVPGVVAVHDLKLRHVGAQFFGEVTVDVPRTFPLQRSRMVQEDVAFRVAEAFPGTELTVSTRPIPLDDETVLDRVMLTAARRRVLVHHVTIQSVDERLVVGLDIEVDGRMRLGEAHDIATGYETALRDELGPDLEVDTHIEPLEIDHLTGQDAPPDVAGEIRRALDERAEGTAFIRDVHNVRVRETPAGLVVTYHCRIDPDLDVTTVHEAIDALERVLRADHPSICRVVGHTDPRP